MTVRNKVNKDKYELIDTLWNVNLNPHELPPKPGIRINRYIMECKYGSRHTIADYADELIDTLWNVNGSVPAGSD